MERVIGVEPTLFRFGRPAPYRLGDTRVIKDLARAAGVEPAARGFGDRCDATISPLHPGVDDRS